MTHQPQALTRVGDFEPAKFTIYAHCGDCGHGAPVDPEKVGQEVEIRTLPARLRCAECGSRAVEIKIAYVAAGRYSHS